MRSILPVMLLARLNVLRRNSEMEIAHVLLATFYSVCVISIAIIIAAIACAVWGVR